MAGILGLGATSVNAPTWGNAGGLLQTAAPNQQWGQGGAAAENNQAEQRMLGVGAAQQGQLYGQQLTQQGQGYGQQLGQLGGQFGQQGQQQYGQLQQAQIQGGQALQNLANAAAGKTPSAAEIQMQQGLDQAARQQMAMAASSRGGFGLANAQYNAANNAAALQQAGVDQAAALRAQEMANAQQAYMQGSLGAGGLASQSAQGFQGQQLGALGQGAQTQLGYEQAGQQGLQQGEALQQGYEQQGIGVQNAAAQNNLGWGQVNAQQQAANQNMWGKVLGGALTAAGTVGGAIVGGPAGAVAGGAAGNAAGNAINSDEGVKREVADAAEAAGYQRGLREASAAPAPMPGPALPPPPTPLQGLALGYTTDQEALQAQGALPPKTAQVVGHYQHQYDETGRPIHDVYDIPDPRLAAAPAMPVHAQPAPRHAVSPRPGDRDFVGPARPAAPLQASLIPSDERVKIDPGTTEPPVDRFLGSLHPKTFRYADSSFEPNPTGAGDRYLGIMAQDLEKTPEGAKIVRENGQGVKMVDVPSLAGASAAALGRLHERLSRLEGRRGAGVR